MSSDTSEANSCTSLERSASEDRRRSDGRRLVKKGSLSETALVQAKLEAAQKGSLSEADRKKARRAANRLAAFQSRQRRKEIIADLQVSECQTASMDVFAFSRLTARCSSSTRLENSIIFIQRLPRKLPFRGEIGD